MSEIDPVVPNSTEHPDSVSSAPPQAETGGRPDGASGLTAAQRLSAWARDNWQIILLVFVFLAMQLFLLGVLNELIFDEEHWVPEARLILEREPLTFFESYTSLGKIFIATGIGILGDNPWGWRISSILFGAISVVLVYLIARTLAGKRTAVLASLLLVSHTLFLSLSGLAMLDISFVTFMLLSLLLYLQKRYALSGLSLALSVLCKPAGILAVFAIMGHWYLTRRKLDLQTVGLFSVTFILALFVLMPVTDFMATGQWFDPFNRLFTLFFLHTTPILPDDPVASKPWEWVLLPGGIRWEADFRYYLMVTPTVWLLTVPSIGYLLYRYFFVRKNRNTPRFVLLWFAATYLLWIPIELVSGRLMYIHYFLPTVGATCIAIGYSLHRVWQRSDTQNDSKARWGIKSLVVIYLLVHVTLFLALSPFLPNLATD